jgi:AcrR family transcriptional regulator
MARSFTDAEKDSIRKRLVAECEKSWAAVGYKKTSIDELCAKAGISKGAFYLFFDSKEQLFCKVMDDDHERIKALCMETLAKSPGKADIAAMMKQIYREYDRANILTQRTGPDFAAFLNRAPAEWKERSKMASENFITKTILNPNIKLKMSGEKAVGIFNALLAIITSKELIGYDHYEIFCTLLDSVIDEIYE